MSEEKIKPIMIRPSPELRRRIEVESKKQNRSMSNLLLNIIIKAFRAQGEAAHAQRQE